MSNIHNNTSQSAVDGNIILRPWLPSVSATQTRQQPQTKQKPDIQSSYTGHYSCFTQTRQ